MKTLIITVGLQRDVENGDVSAVVVEMTEENAAKLLHEQGECSLVSDGGALSNLINAYAQLCGYQCGWFVMADAPEEIIRRGSEGANKINIERFDIVLDRPEGRND